MIWRTIPSSPKYEASDTGLIRNAKRGNVLAAPLSCEGGHPIVCIHGRARPVHALVLEAFVGPRPPGLECRHRDDVKSNNHVSNLVWGTRSENMHDRVRNGIHSFAIRTECSSGHAFDETNTEWRRDGSRRCRECHRTYMRERYRRSIGK